MNDNDVRQALRERAGRADVGDAVPPGWGDVEQRAAALRRSAATRRAMVIGSVAAAVMVLAGAVALLNDDDGKRLRTVGPAGSTTTTADETTTTTAEPTTTTAAAVVTTEAPTTTALPDPAGVGGIYPTAADYRRVGAAKFADPKATALAFAKDYVGMRTPVAGSPRKGAGATTLVDIRPNSRATLTTTVELRQVGGAGGPWTVTGATAESITLAAPGRDAKIGSPVRVTGSAQAFEGHVNVEVREEGQRAGQSLGETFVTGAGDHKGPFEGEVSFRRPSKSRGAIVLYDSSAEDGSPIAATVVRITF